MERSLQCWTVGLSWFWLLPALALAQIGEVSALRGAASVVRDNGVSVLQVGMAVDREDVLQVATDPADSQLEIRLADGSLLRVDAGAQLVLIDYQLQAPNGVVDLIRGHVWLEVQRTFSRRRNAFRVRTRHGTAGVQGTRFGIDSRTARTLFKVFEGRVSVWGRDGRLLATLKDGESVVLDASGVVRDPAP